MIDGQVAAGFEPVADVFRENFRRRGELGAAVAVYRGEQCLVDLWGGIADRARGTPWRRDSVVLVFSTTKGLSALTLALAHARGLFDFDEPVSRYWPEFAEAGKKSISVRQLLAHQAGLAVIDAPLTRDILADPDLRDAVLARQRPVWPPGERHGYHATSIGLYESALLRRCDAQGRGVGAYFADELARPLGLEFWIGLPRGFDPERIAKIWFVPPWSIPRMPLGMVLAAANPWSLFARAVTNPRIDRLGDLASPAAWELENPSGIGVGEVRAIARVYGEFAAGSLMLGVGRATLDALARPAVSPSGGELDMIVRTPTRFSLGFMKPSDTLRFGSSDSAYGAPGFGGSFGFADPDLGIGFAYAPNRTGLHLVNDPRERALRDSVYRCLGV